MKKPITQKEAAGKLQCSLAWVREIIKRGDLRATKINSRIVLIEEEDITDYERRRTTVAR